MLRPDKEALPLFNCVKLSKSGLLFASAFASKSAVLFELGKILYLFFEENLDAREF